MNGRREHWTTCQGLSLLPSGFSKIFVELWHLLVFIFSEFEIFDLFFTPNPSLNKFCFRSSWAYKSWPYFVSRWACFYLAPFDTMTLPIGMVSVNSSLPFCGIQFVFVHRTFAQRLFKLVWKPTFLFQNSLDFKNVFNNHVRYKVRSCPNSSKSFWTLARIINQNFGESSFYHLFLKMKSFQVQRAKYFRQTICLYLYSYYPKKPSVINGCNIMSWWN